MYVPPRPRLDDDPLFAIRLAFIAVCGLLGIQLFEPAMPPLLAVLPLALAASMRLAFDPIRTVGSALAVIALSYAVTFIIVLVRPMPALMILVMFSLFFIGFFIIQRTGNPIGMAVLAVATLLSIMGVKDPILIYLVRDSFAQSGIVIMVAIPLGYLFFPALSTQRHVYDVLPAAGHHGHNAAVRAIVLMIFCLWLYAVLPATDMLLAVAAIFPLVYPTRGTAWAEAWERSLATVLGSIASLAILTIIGYNAHFLIVAGLLALAALYFGSAMITGSRPATLYQNSLTTTGALVVGALSTPSPAYAAFTRTALTMIGVLGAVVLMVLIEYLLKRRRTSLE